MYMERNNRMLGQLLIDVGKLTKEELEDVLKNKPDDKKLGQYLMDIGKITPNDLEEALLDQKQLKIAGVKRKKFRVGEYLVETGRVTEEQLEDILKVKEVTKEKVGEIVVRIGIIPQEELNEIIERQTGVKTVDLDNYNYRGEAYKVITKRLALMYNVLPLEVDETAVRVAMYDPFDLSAVDTIMMFTGLEVVPVFAKKDQIERKIDELYSI